MLKILHEDARSQVDDDRLRVRVLSSSDALRSAAAEWDDLWKRSAAALPVARAATIADWLEHFALGATFSGIVVERGDHALAALPLYGHRFAGWLTCGMLPGNAWSPAGDLLLAADADVDAVLDALCAGLARLSWPLVVLPAVPADSARWQAFQRALARARLPFVARPRFRVNQVEINHDWAAYLARNTASRCRQMKRIATRLRAEGNCQLRVLSDLPPDEVESWLTLGFEIEDRSWKGFGGTSVLKSPGMLDFFLRQARQLAAWGQLELVFLEVDDEPIAFEYGWSSKGVYHSLKVGYDEYYAALTPGQALRAQLLEQFQGRPDRRLVDYMGPASRATSDFATGDYPMARLVVGTGGIAGRALLSSYRKLWPLISRLRRPRAKLVEPSLHGRS